jgi:oligopeptide/dipeptide ABC transporter ATP-binding protein
MPSLDTLDRPIRPIPGQVPAAANLPAHCRFLERCDMALAACRVPVSLARPCDDRRSRCLRALEVGDD